MLDNANSGCPERHWFNCSRTTTTQHRHCWSQWRVGDTLIDIVSVTHSTSQENPKMGVTFRVLASLVGNYIASKPGNLLTGHCDRIITLYLSIHNKQQVVLFSTYALTVQIDPMEKDKENCSSSTPQSLILPSKKHAANINGNFEKSKAGDGSI
ncbi:hypothetical protein LOAG_13021 [Loa loa]|uniref:Late endosomal/lysosomal adaptor and MAPK and MTOR activator 5 n=1 Tax=Loa loa TaxID=7209 RepID=A0A1I7V9R4_LOALO|nr:hypothetical protein LOAG_13021 [Loa loa]EFO15489.1 hypothetical protein LOAG_13021 [Loa loa]